MENKILDDCVNEVVKENPDVTSSHEGFFEAISQRFIEKRLEEFPKICDVTRIQNWMKYEEMKEKSYKGKYTDTYGWSKDGTFKFDFDIPQDLYLFMINLVYKDFWGNDNEKVWRKFMNKICSRTSPMTILEAQTLLIKTKQIYGPNSDRSLVNG